MYIYQSNLSCKNTFSVCKIQRKLLLFVRESRRTQTQTSNATSIAPDIYNQLIFIYNRFFTYQQQGDVREESSSNNQQDHRPAEPETQSPKIKPMTFLKNKNKTIESLHTLCLIFSLKGLNDVN